MCRSGWVLACLCLIWSLTGVITLKFCLLHALINNTVKPTQTDLCVVSLRIYVCARLLCLFYRPGEGQKKKKAGSVSMARERAHPAEGDRHTQDNWLIKQAAACWGPWLSTILSFLLSRIHTNTHTHTPSTLHSLDIKQENINWRGVSWEIERRWQMDAVRADTSWCRRDPGN